MAITHEYASKAQMSILAVGALGCFLLAVLTLRWTRRSSSPSPSASLPLPPGTFGFLWVSETFKFFHALRTGEPSKFLRDRSARFRSNTFTTRLFFHKTAVVQGAAANCFIASAENKQQLFNSWPASMIAVMGKHVPIAKHGEQHRLLRQIMTSCLSPGALRKVVGKADLMTQLHFEECWNTPSQVCLLSLIKQNTFRIACSLLAGAEDEAMVARIYETFKIWSAGILSLPVDLPGTAFRRAKNAKQMLAREISKLMDSKQQMTSADDPNGVDLLSLLMRAQDENGSFLSREELQDVILFLLLAGYDTSTATLSFVLKFLEQNSDCYDRLLEEHKAISSHKNLGERLTWTDVRDMKYTWAVIQETMRLRPVVTGSLKEAKHDLIFDGYRIPRGWKMYFSMSSTHSDQQFFPEPNKFDPSRFEFERLPKGNGPPPYVFVPFGIGPHSCPGSDFARMTMSTYLHHLALRQIKWASIDPDEKFHVFPTLKLAKDYPAKIFLDK